MPNTIKKFQPNEIPPAGQGRFSANGVLHKMKNSDKKQAVEIIVLPYFLSSIPKSQKKSQRVGLHYCVPSLSEGHTN